MTYRSVRLTTLRARRCGHSYAESKLFCRNPSVTLPSLQRGATLLPLFGLRDELAATGPRSLPVHCSEMHVLTDALVQSDSGIIALSRTGEVLEDTLDHTDPERDGYEREPDDNRQEGRSIRLRSPERMVRGRYLSLLLGNQSNYFHWLIMNVGRLAITQRRDLGALDGVLVPAGLEPAQTALLGRLPMLDGLPLCPVAPRESLMVERVVLLWNAASGTSFDPNIIRFLRRSVLGRQAAQPGTRIRALYIDRRWSPSRPMINEPEIISTVTRLGAVPVRLETLPVDEQAKLFREARLVVAPHGAGLANLVFAAPGLRVIELMPSGCVNWCFRILAALCGHDYDLAVGRSVPTGAVAPIWQPWVASPTHLASILHEQMCA